MPNGKNPAVEALLSKVPKEDTSVQKTTERSFLEDLEDMKEAYANPTQELIEAERKMQEFEKTHKRLFRINGSGEYKLDFAEIKRQ